MNTTFDSAAPADPSHRQKSAILCHLGNIALRTESVLEVDPKTGRILKIAAAMNLWKREYRAGWEPTGLVRS